MQKIFVTSDLHIGHDKEFMWGARGFANIEEHDRILAERWNKAVAPSDMVYILGDVMLNDIDHGMSVLKQLNGTFIILRGNHDSESKVRQYLKCEKVRRAGCGPLSLKYPAKGGYQFYLTHYPSLKIHEDKKRPRWLRATVINLYGHIHQKEHFYQGDPCMYCVCMDAHDMTPVCLDDVIDEIRMKWEMCKIEQGG